MQTKAAFGPVAHAFCAAIVVACVSIAFGQQRQRFDGNSVLRVSVPDEASLQTVLKLTEDVWSHHVAPGGTIDVRITPEQRRAIDQAGLSYEVFIPDIEPLIEAQMVPPLREADFSGNYHTYAEIESFIDDAVANYPTFVQKVEFGETLQNRKMWGVRITGPTSPAFKPAVLYHGGQHAREWITVATCCYLIDHLLANYGTDPEITDLVDRVQWYILPIMNPDGYVYTWDVNRMWRKNRVPHSDGTYGTDNNRNWAEGWGLDNGSSGEPGADTYRGWAPFSEKESFAISRFINNHDNIRAYMDLHSYSQLVLWPWGYKSDLNPDNDTFNLVGQTMMNRLHATHGQTYVGGPTYTAIYPVSGGSIDWVYANHGILAYSIEERDRGQYGFLLPPEQIVPASEEVVSALMYLTWWVAPQIYIALPDGLPTPAPGDDTATFSVRMQDSGETAQPGSELIHYRTGPTGPFTAEPLTSLGGEMYEASIPIGCQPLTQFYVEATGDAGTTITLPRDFTAQVLTIENDQPLSAVATPAETWKCADSDLTITTTTAGSGPLTYQWQKDGQDIPGATDAVLNLHPVTASGFGAYALLVGDTCGNQLASNDVVVHEATVTFTEQPQSSRPCSGKNAWLEIATDPPEGAVTYQWYHNGVPISGATHDYLYVTDLGEDDGGDYYCIASIDCLHVSSDVATLDVQTVSLVEQPLSRCASTGDAVTFSVVAEGENLNYQWRKNGTAIPGESSPTLTINPVDAGDQAVYRVVVFTLPDVCVASSADASLLVDTCTTCWSRPGDMDGDSDLDLLDYAVIQACFAPQQPTRSGCECADIDGTGAVDAIDYELFTADLTGP